MVKGVYHDELTGPRGRVWRSGWRPNSIVVSCHQLLAALMKRHQGTQGILYWAVGSGEPEWDAAAPASSSATTHLANELTRLPVSVDQMSFLDETDAPSEAPTDRLEVRVEFDAGALAPGGFISLREFGLFGGSASESADSGLLVNYVVHPRIDLSAGATLHRRLRITFASGAEEGESGPEPAPGTPIALEQSMPVSSIGGVGEVYGAMLAAQGVHTIGDLIGIDPLVAIGGIPMVLLREFRAKARLALGLRVDLAPFRALWDRSVSEVLLERPEPLLQIIGGSRVTVRDVVRLQEQLAFLQIAMVDSQLQQVTLGQLAGT